jgi:hypothetical protein
MEAILRSLSDVHPEYLDAALMQAMQECDYWPRVSEIRSRVKDDSIGYDTPIYCYDEFSNCRKSELDDQDAECFIPPNRVKRKPAMMAKFLCGCGTCAPWLWCTMTVEGKRCKELAIFDAKKKKRGTLCAAHVYDISFPIRETPEQFKDITSKMHWELLAEKLVKDVGGKEGCMQLREAMGWDRKKFDDAIMGRDEQDKARRRELSKRMQTPDDIPI